MHSLLPFQYPHDGMDRADIDFQLPGIDESNRALLEDSSYGFFEDLIAGLGLNWT